MYYVLVSACKHMTMEEKYLSFFIKHFLCMYVFLYLSRFFVDLPNTPKGISSYYCSKFYASSKTYSGIFRVPFFLSVS